MAPSGFSQTRERRLEDALVDITLLKRLIKEQDRRIADLEKTVKSLQAGTAAVPEPLPAERPRPVVRPMAKWQNPLAWSRIQEGLSRAQVEEILGKPTTVEAVIDYQTLIYKSDASSSNSLTGSVKLTDDRVSQVIPPAF
jgi:hypothetical protein